MKIVSRFRERTRSVISWVKRRVKRSEIGDLQNGMLILRDVAKRRSCRVSDVASRATMPSKTVLNVLTEMEVRGLVRLSKDRGVDHARVVAVTRKGRAVAKR
jgi:DNA-binding MarR family transcriptional regulator